MIFNGLKGWLKGDSLFYHDSSLKSHTPQQMAEHPIKFQALSLSDLSALSKRELISGS